MAYNALILNALAPRYIGYGEEQLGLYYHRAFKTAK